MSKQKVEIRKLKGCIVELETKVDVLKDALAKAEARALAYGEQIERVRGAYLIRQLEEAGIKYHIHTCRWAVTLPAGILEVESLPAAINAIRENAAPADMSIHKSSLNPAQDADQ